MEGFDTVSPLSCIAGQIHIPVVDGVSTGTGAASHPPPLLDLSPCQTSLLLSRWSHPRHPLLWLVSTCHYYCRARQREATTPGCILTSSSHAQECKLVTKRKCNFRHSYGRKSSFRRARRFEGSLASRAVIRARARAASIYAGARQNMRVRIPSTLLSFCVRGWQGS